MLRSGTSSLLRAFTSLSVAAAPGAARQVANPLRAAPSAARSLYYSGSHYDATHMRKAKNPELPPDDECAKVSAKVFGTAKIRYPPPGTPLWLGWGVSSLASTALHAFSIADTATPPLQGYLGYKKPLLKKTHRIRPLCFLKPKKIGPTGFSCVFLFLRKHRPTGFSCFLMN
jgi:hypothetical protein